MDEIDLSDVLDGLVEAQNTLMEHDVAHALASELAQAPDLLSTELRSMIERGGLVEDAEAARVIELADARGRLLASRLEQFDAVLTPATVGEAPVGLASTGDPLFCRSWTLLGTPAISVPGRVGEAGMPVGVQLVAPPRADRRLLAVAEWAGAVHAGPSRGGVARTAPAHSATASNLRSARGGQWGAPFSRRRRGKGLRERLGRVRPSENRHAEGGMIVAVDNPKSSGSSSRCGPIGVDGAIILQAPRFRTRTRPNRSRRPFRGRRRENGTRPLGHREPTGDCSAVAEWAGAVLATPPREGPA